MFAVEQMDSPVGPLFLVATRQEPQHLLYCSFGSVEEAKTANKTLRRWGDPATMPRGSSLLKEACQQLEAYFAGKRKIFDLALEPEGTPFQRRVWSVLASIPYGERWSYGELAQKAGWSKHHARAVGQAVGRNPLAILLPCHRVVGATSHLVGFGGGLAIKEKLLALETGNSNSVIVQG